MQAETDLFNIGFGLRLDRKGQYRPRKRRLRITNRGLLITERVTGLRIPELPNGHDLPRSCRSHGSMFLPQQRIEMSAFLSAVARTIEDRRISLKNSR